MIKILEFQIKKPQRQKSLNMVKLNLHYIMCFILI